MQSSDQPIISPANPHRSSLRLFPGSLIKVAGRPRPNAVRFAINLQTGPSFNPRDDLVLHLSPCFNPPRIIRNTLQNGVWGLEESWGNGTILSPHAPFEIMIYNQENHFKIAINGVHYCEFQHRMRYQEVTHLTIDGDVDIDRITVTSMGEQQPIQPPMPQYSGGQPSGYNNYPPNPPLPSMPPMPSSAGGGYNPTSANYPPLPTASTGIYPAAPPMPQAPYGGPPQPQYVPQGNYPYPGGPQGPNAAPHGYQGGYPGHPSHPAQPSSSSSSGGMFGSFGNKALGTVAGLAAGAALLSATSPLKSVKKMMKPHKAFKHKGWGKSSSSSNSSISSRGSISSNSS